MNRVKELLDLRRLNTVEIEERFEEIANLLLQEYQIKKGADMYDFLQIEFYYYAKEHEDVITYPRTIEAGKWFFHSSGVDLTFLSKCENRDFLESDGVGNDYFGGILIKAIKKNGKDVIEGHQKTSWELFDYFDAFEMKKEEYPLIIRKAKEEKVIKKGKRKITFNENKDTDKIRAEKRFKKGYLKFIDFLGAEYQFYVER